MGVSRIDNWPAFLVGSSDGLWIDNFGRIVLEPDNFWPNQYGQDVDENGEPEAWDLTGVADPIIGYHVNLSKPGDPRRQSIARQTTTFVPTNEGSWLGGQPWVAGGRIAPTDERVPTTPDIDDVPNNTRGWTGGVYGYALGFGSLWGDTTVSGTRYFELADGEYPIIPVPEGFATGVQWINIYMTELDGGDDTLRLQLRVPVSQIRGRDIPVYGPRVDRGKPPSTNKSGVGRPQKPPNRSAKTRSSSRGDTMAGTWEAAYQLYIPGMGASLVGKTGKRIKVKGDKKRVKVNDNENVEGAEDVRAVNTTPPGRRRGAKYYGEEIDPVEARFVGALNGARAADGERNDLVLNAALNRAAWRHVNEGGSLADIAYDEGYADPAIGTTSKLESPYHVLDELVRYPGLRVLDEWREVGVARGRKGWSVILGSGEPEIPTVATYETVDPDGTIRACDPSAHPGDPDYEGVQFADATAQLAWDCVVSGSLNYNYNGSYDSAVQHAARQMESACGLTMDSGGTVLDITDGALPAGVAGRTYSDGRIILSSSLMSGATANAREAIATHETGHAGRLAHDTGTTVMRTSITLNSSNNINVFTDEDKDTLTSLWGSADVGGTSGGGGGSGGGEAKGTGGNEIKQPREEDESSGDGPTRWDVRESSIAKNTVLLTRPPKVMRRSDGRAVGMKYTAWWFHRDDNGNETAYVVRPKGPRVGAAAYFNRQIRVAGVPGGEAVEGEGGKNKGGFVLVAESPPDTDETEIESPDPTSAPDAPFIGGQELLPAGRYVADVQGVTARGDVTRPSDLARNDDGDPYVDITLETMPKVYLPQTVNLIKNAEGGTIDKNGAAEDWVKLSATTPAYFNPRLGGGFDVGTTGSTANLARGQARRIFVSDDTPFTIAGDIGVWRQSLGGGGVRVALRAFDVEDVSLGTLVAGSLNAIGDIKFVKQYGPGGEAWPAGVAYVLPEIGLYQPATGNVNVEGYVTNIRAFPYPEDIGKVVLDGNFGDFEPLPDAPAPSGSFMAVGLPPSPGAGTEPAESEPPAAYTGFEGSVPGTGFTTGGNVAPTYVTGATAIHEDASIRFADASKNAKQTSWVESTVASLDGVNAYFRGLYIFDALPGRGRSRFHAHYDGANIRYGLAVDNLGRIVVEYAGADNQLVLKTLSTKVVVGQLIDIETVFIPGANGVLELYIGLGGQRRTRADTIPFNLDGLNGNRLIAGLIAHSDSAARPILRADQLVATPRGDVANREQPPAPEGVSYVPAPVDRPFDGEVPREFDPDAETIYQLRGFIEPGTTDNGPRIIPLLDEPMNVRPGVTYAFGAYCRYTGFTDDVSEFRVILTGEDMAPLSVAYIPLSGKLAWADRMETFTVPDGYTYASPELALWPSFIVAQEFANSRGAALVRGFGRAELGTGTFEIDAVPDKANFPRFLSEVGAKELADPSDVAPGTLTATIATTNDKISYLPYTDPVDKALRYYRIDLEMTGDGRNGPEVSDLYARTWCPVGQVCDPDGAPINAYVGNLFTASEYPDVEPRRAAGRSANVPDSDDLLHGSPIEITAFDEDAANLVMLLSRRGTLQFNVPTAGGTAAGRSYEVRIEGGIKLIPEPQLAGITPDGRRDVIYKGTAEVVDVLAEGILPAPMGFIDMTFTPTVGTGETELVP
jgi:hypothetical protein